MVYGRVHSRRSQWIRDIPVAGPVEVRWWKRRFFCDEYLCPRRTFAEETAQAPRRARSTPAGTPKEAHPRRARTSHGPEPAGSPGIRRDDGPVP
ncbi:hypothetical protein [Arthrobacter sp. NPDC056493]|uniref:hypothetical protein n=1 Tax=Arthrobacter sp. NPDC056493 TaxID=3345839 RepID=UPI003670183A